MSDDTDAPELRREAQNTQENNVNDDEAGAMRDWVHHECDVLKRTIEAECLLDKLMRDRLDLAKELEALSKASNPETSGESVDRFTMLREYIDLRNLQIADIQREIVESDQENRGTTRLNAIQSMSDAKAAINVLFETIADYHKKKDAKENENVEFIMEKYNAILLKNRQYELRQGSQEKLKEEPTLYREKCEELEKELNSYKEKCERLEEQLSSMEFSSMTKERQKTAANVASRIRHASESDAYNSSSYHIADSAASSNIAEQPFLSPNHPSEEEIRGEEFSAGYRSGNFRGKSFTEEEQGLMIRWVLDNNLMNSVHSEKTWAAMIKEGLLTHRTSASLRTHFQRIILRDLEMFQFITDEVVVVVYD